MLLLQAINSSTTITENKISWHWSNITSDIILVAIIGIVVVFFALFVLSVIYSYLPKLVNMRFKLLFKKKTGRVPTKEELDIPGEINAAIGAALHFYFNDFHDFEDTTLTINREVKRKSPWADRHQMLYQHSVK